MTARQPRRTRRRVAPAAALPRPTSDGSPALGDASARLQARNPLHHRQHHVSRDYGYVHRDLLTVAAVGAAVLGFIVAMSFVL